MAEENALSGLLVELPVRAGQPLHWWRLAHGAVVDSGMDIGLPDMDDGDRIVALVPVSHAPVFILDRTDLPARQAEAVAARQLAARSLGDVQVATAVAVNDASIMGAVVSNAVLTQGLALLADMDIAPDFVIPAALVARTIWFEGDAAVVEADVMGERQCASDSAAFAADDSLATVLTPNIAPMVATDELVTAALESLFAMPNCNFLTKKFAPKNAHPIDARRGKILIGLLGAALVLTLAIGLASWWRFAAAAAAADARALTALSKAIGPQNDVASGESALDARLAREGRGAAVMSAPLSALYQAMQAAPQVSLRQLRYTPDGTMLATMAAPTSEAANAILLRLQQDGYKVTATTRTDDSGAQVVDVTIRGY